MWACFDAGQLDKETVGENAVQLDIGSVGYDYANVQKTGLSNASNTTDDLSVWDEDKAFEADVKSKSDNEAMASDVSISDSD